MSENNNIIKITSRAGLSFEFLPGGQVFSVRFGEILINLLFGCPIFGGMQKLFLRLFDKKNIFRYNLFENCKFFYSQNAAFWEGKCADFSYRVNFLLEDKSWCFRVKLKNCSNEERFFDLIKTFDIGLIESKIARTNEFYVSQYVDYRQIEDEKFSKILLARQNLPVNGMHPRLAMTIMEGLYSYSTDAYEVYYDDWLENAVLPGRVKQSELSCAALQSKPEFINAGDEKEFNFLFSYIEKNEGDDAQNAFCHIANKTKELDKQAVKIQQFPYRARNQYFASFIDGEDFSVNELKKLFPKKWRNVEKNSQNLLSFFYGKVRSNHVVLAAKDRSMLRSHGHILRSGSELSPFGETNNVGQSLHCELLSMCSFANGVFISQLTVGNTYFHGLLSPLRGIYSLARAAGLRIWLKFSKNEAWLQLGRASVFEISARYCRWFYKFGDNLVQVSLNVEKNIAFSALKIKIIKGKKAQILITNELSFSNEDLNFNGISKIDKKKCQVFVEPNKNSPMKENFAHSCFGFFWQNCKEIENVGFDEMIFQNKAQNSLAFLNFKTISTREFSLFIGASLRSREELEENFKKIRFNKKDNLFNPKLLIYKKKCRQAKKLNDILPWFLHNALIHYSVPRGLEQYNAGAWGVRDVAQGPVEMLIFLGKFQDIKQILKIIFSHQYKESLVWPQWFMIKPYENIQQVEMHGDIPFWPLYSLILYLENTEDFDFLNEKLPWYDYEKKQFTKEKSALYQHVEAIIKWFNNQCIPGTKLISYGSGDWNDSLQPANKKIKNQLVSCWTIALSYQVLRGLEKISQKSGIKFSNLEKIADKIKQDFNKKAIIDKILSGFLLFDKKFQKIKPIIHPNDKQSCISYRLLPINRSIISNLFTKEQAQRHIKIAFKFLQSTDGMRLMDKPPNYNGGKMTTFQRAESASFFGREIGMHYTHAHLRFCQALAKLGKADELLWGLECINPVKIHQIVSNAALRQSNAYFSSSDAQVNDRYEAQNKIKDVMKGKITVNGGWRIYSSGPGIFLYIVKNQLLGLRMKYSQIIIDPVLSKKLDKLIVKTNWINKKITFIFSVKNRSHSPEKIIINDKKQEFNYRNNPFRQGGAQFDKKKFIKQLNKKENLIKIYL